jgi:hypothetical protein
LIRYQLEERDGAWATARLQLAVKSAAKKEAGRAFGFVKIQMPAELGGAAVGSIGWDRACDPKDSPMNMSRKNPTVITLSTRADHLISANAGDVETDGEGKNVHGVRLTWLPGH